MQGAMRAHCKNNELSLGGQGRLPQRRSANTSGRASFSMTFLGGMCFSDVKMCFASSLLSHSIDLAFICGVSFAGSHATGYNFAAP